MISDTRTTWRVAAFLLLAAAISQGLYWPDSRRHNGVEAMLDASVSVKTLSHVRIDVMGDSVWSPTSGSGFLISSSNCEVLTNQHVVANAAHIEIFPRRWSEATGIRATVVNANPKADIAILRMEYCTDISEALLGDSETLSPGDEVYAVGNPLGRNPGSISRGIVSHTERFTSGIIPYIQTDASINRGSSGGALFNRQGKVIGINSAIIAAPNGSSLGVGYALPINRVKSEIEQLRNGPPTWGETGIEDRLAGLTEHQAAFFKVPSGQAAIIVTDTPDSGPSKDKLFAKDVIYEIGNTSVTSINHARQLISRYRPGETITFKIVRSGALANVDVSVEEGREDPELHSADYYSGHLGLTLEMWDDEESLGGRYDSPVITLVKGLGPAHLARVTSSQKTFARSGTASGSRSTGCQNRFRNCFRRNLPCRQIHRCGR